MHPAIQQFQQWLNDTYSGDERFAALHALTGDLVGLRLEVAETSHYEIAVNPAAGTVRVGFLTADRSLNEEIEQAILDSGDSLDELIEAELDELGAEPTPMAHFFERPFFCYTTTLPFADLADLASDDLRSRCRHLIDACCALFQDYIEE